MTIISYPEIFKTKRVISINSSRLQARRKNKASRLSLIFLIFLGLVFFGLYVYLRNAQTTLLIKEKQLKKEIEILKTQNNFLEAKLSQFNSFSHFQEVAENLGYRLEAHPYYLGGENNLSLR